MPDQATLHEAKFIRTETCTRCGGRGTYGSIGTCFLCGGRGTIDRYEKLTPAQMADNGRAVMAEHDQLEVERVARFAARKARSAELVATGMDKRSADRQARQEIK